MSDLADSWNVGELSSADVYAVLAQRSGLPVDEVARHAAACCRNLTFHTAAWAAASARLYPQAIVTVNPDLFEQHIVPRYRLDEVFDVIVTSCTARTDDKVRLCEIAVDRLRHDGLREDVLLIDNRLDLVQAWEASGGRGYWFRGDDQFAQDRSSLGL
jgi:phosphoglycolate phosphatase-like HAD superfamily hydrolase